MNHFALGWSTAWDHYLDRKQIESFVRITARHKGSYSAISTSGDALNCHASGKLLHNVSSTAQLPAVGDWCLISPTFIDGRNEKAAVIEEVLPRQSHITRMVAGTETGEQVLAANVDFVFAVTSLNRDFSINRLRRYILIAEHGDAEPVIVLSKLDLCSNDDLHLMSDQITSAFPAVQSITTSALSFEGLESIKNLLQPGKTAVFLGSSGVGKSSLVNALLSANVQETNSVRESDDTGKHTTSRSGLFLLNTGGIVIDTPGLREVHVIGDEEDVDCLLPAVAEFADGCRFSDCAHANEPGCAVRAAVDDGALDRTEFEAYKKLEREAAYSKRKVSQRSASEERKKLKKITIKKGTKEFRFVEDV